MSMASFDGDAHVPLWTSLTSAPVSPVGLWRTAKVSLLGCASPGPCPRPSSSMDMSTFKLLSAGHPYSSSLLCQCTAVWDQSRGSWLLCQARALSFSTCPLTHGRPGEHCRASTSSSGSRPWAAPAQQSEGTVQMCSAKVQPHLTCCAQF